MTTTSLKLPELDYSLLDKEMDRTKTKVFLGDDPTFLGSIMSRLNFSWVEDIETACTNGISLWWNPHFFLAMKPEVRSTILKHELWHPARLDMLRRGTRDPEIWNWAADIWINNTLIREGNSFEGFKPWYNFDYEGWITEDIYDDLAKKYDAAQEKVGHSLPLPAPWLINPVTGKSDKSDLVEPEETDIEHAILNNVVSASHSARLSGGSVPGDVETTLKRFLQPKIAWEKVLYNFFNDLAGQDYRWNRPNRRYQDMYLPSLQDDNNGLVHLMYFEDVSGSISDGDSIRFNSEFKYVKDTFEPDKMTMIQFDTIIQKVDVFLKEDPFDEVKIVGRGGTSLECVREYIIEHKPTAVVVFSDLCCEPMEALPAGLNIPIIWIALNNRNAKVNMGQLVHLHD